MLLLSIELKEFLGSVSVQLDMTCGNEEPHNDLRKESARYYKALYQQ